MKILKKFLIIGLFSFLFIVNAYASVNFTNTSITTLDNYINNHNQGNTNLAIENYKKSILDFISLPSDNYISDNYIIALDNSSQNSTSIKIQYLSSTYYQNVAYNYNYGNKALYLNTNNSGNYNWCYKTLYFNSSGEVTRQDNNWTCMPWSGALGIMTSNTQLYIISTNYPYFTYKSPTWNTDSFSIGGGTEYVYESSQIPVNFLNGNKYNFVVNDYYASPEPMLYQPQIEYFNGYNKVTYYIDNYSIDSNNNGYFVRIVNNTDGTFENISPDINNLNQIIVKNYYENVNLSIEVHDREYNVLSHYDINTNITYNEQGNYSIQINNVSNSQKIVYYDYIINNNNNVKCYYSINDNNFIEDTNCTDTNTTYYLQLNNNGNISWQIRDLQNNILYKYSQNFVFDVSEPYINFNDHFENDFLNLNVLINRHQTNDIVEYSINDGNFVPVSFLEDWSISQNIKYFTINNVNDGDLIKVRIKRNSQVIATAEYKANYVKYYNNSGNNWDINDIFKKINIENVNNELKEYIKNFGNLIINSKIGNLLLLQTFCLIIILIIKMIRN